MGAMFLACAWVQWTFLETGIVLTPSRLFFSAASIFYLIEFIPGFATLTSYCYGEMWHDFGEVQATMAMIFFLLLLAVVAPLSAGVYAVSEWNRGKGA